MNIVNETLLLSHYNLTSIKYNKLLYNFLSTSLTHNNIIKAPSNVKDKTNYLLAFAIYLNPEYEVELNEAILFYLAVHAYIWKNSEPLLRLAKTIKIMNDACYWLFLAQHPTVFNYTIRLEMARYGLDKLPRGRLEDLTEYKKFDDPEGYLVDQTVRLLNPRRSIRSIPLVYPIHQDIITLSLPINLNKLSDILDLELFKIQGLAIGGSMITNLVNKRQSLNKLNQVNYRHFDVDLATVCILYYINHRHLSKHTLINHLYSELNVTDLNITTDEELLPQLRRYVTMKYPEYFVLEDDEIYVCTDYIGYSIDLHFYGDDPKASMLEVLEFLESKYRELSYGHYDYNTTVTIPGKPNFYNLDRTDYRDLDDILMSMEFDSQRFLLYKNDQSEIDYVCTESFIESSRYDIDLIVPSHIYNKTLEETDHINYLPRSMPVNKISAFYDELERALDQDNEDQSYDEEESETVNLIDHLNIKFKVPMRGWFYIDETCSIENLNINIILGLWNLPKLKKFDHLAQELLPDNDNMCLGYDDIRTSLHLPVVLLDLVIAYYGYYLTNFIQTIIPNKI